MSFLVAAIVDFEKQIFTAGIYADDELTQMNCLLLNPVRYDIMASADAIVCWLDMQALVEHRLQR